MTNNTETGTIQQYNCIAEKYGHRIDGGNVGEYQIRQGMCEE
jgi:hypothetical protein